MKLPDDVPAEIANLPAALRPVSSLGRIPRLFGRGETALCARASQRHAPDLLDEAARTAFIAGGLQGATHFGGLRHALGEAITALLG